MRSQPRRVSTTWYASIPPTLRSCDDFPGTITDLGASQKLKHQKDKKKHKAVVKDKRKKGLLPEKKDEPKEEEWEDDEDEEDEDSDAEDPESGLFDLEADESEGDESEDEELGGVRPILPYNSTIAHSRLTTTKLDHISSSPPKRERNRL